MVINMITNSAAVQALFRAGVARDEIVRLHPELAGKRQLLAYHERAARAKRAPRRIPGLLPRDVFDQLCAAAAQAGLTPADFVAQLVADYTADPVL